MELNDIKNNYIVLQGWMRTELDLTENELILYALIYGFTQDGRSEFSGTLEYMKYWTGIKKDTNLLNNIKKLLTKGLLTKRDEGPNGRKKCFYKAIIPKNITPLPKQEWTSPETDKDLSRKGIEPLPKKEMTSPETRDNNIIYNKDNINHNIDLPPIIPQTDFEIIDYVVEKDYEFADVEIVDDLDFENVWKMYGEHGNKYLAQCEYKLIPLEDKRKVIQHIPEYNKSISDIRYKKKFENYLRTKEYNVKPINRNNNGPRTTKQSSLTDEDIFDIVSRAYSDDL